MNGSEIPAAVIYRKGPLTAEDYDEAIRDLQAAKSQLQADGQNCAVCHDSGHQAWECRFNALVMARRAAVAECTWICFHCGEIFTTVAQARDHFGSPEVLPAGPACVATPTPELFQAGRHAAELRVKIHALEQEIGRYILKAASGQLRIKRLEQVYKSACEVSEMRRQENELLRDEAPEENCAVCPYSQVISRECNALRHENKMLQELLQGAGIDTQSV